MLNRIISLKGSTRYYFFQTVYEWEDAIHKVLGLPITRMNPLRKLYYQHRDCSGFSLYNDLSKDNYLAFVMNVDSAKLYAGYSCVPVFLDVFTDTAPKLVEVTRNCQIFFVCSQNMYLHLKHDYGCANVRFIPQPVSDLLVERAPVKKQFDVVQFGRSNRKLHEWMLRYVEEYPNIEYIYRKEGWKSTGYYSTQKGEIGSVKTRRQFLGMLGATKVCLVSARGKDELEGDKGYDFITPRIYEAAAAKCQLIGRYSDNYDSECCGIRQVCSCPETYEEFRDALTDRLEHFDRLDGYQEFIAQNLASKRVREIMRMIEEVQEER